MSENMESSIIPEETEQIQETEVQPAEVLPEAPVEIAEEKPKKIKKIRKRPWPLKILMSLLAILLCIALFVVTIAGALVLDLHALTSKGGIEKVLTQLFTASISASAQPAQPAPGIVQLSDMSAPPSSDFSNFITDTVYDLLQDIFEEEIPLSKDEVNQFIVDSTVTEFLSDKFAGVVDDFINETNNTTISKSEIMDLLRENVPVIEEHFDIQISDDQLTQVEEALDEIPILEDLETNGLIGYVEDTLLNPDASPDDSGVGGINDSLVMLTEAMSYVRLVASNSTLLCVIGVFTLLALLVWLVNWSIPKTLSDIGITLLFAGLILSAVNIAADMGLLQIILSEEPAISGLLVGIISSFAVVHHSILGTGVGLIILAIVAKIIKSHRYKKAMLAAA